MLPGNATKRLPVPHQSVNPLRPTTAEKAARKLAEGPANRSERISFMHAFVPTSGVSLGRHVSPISTCSRSFCPHRTQFLSRRPIRPRGPPPYPADLSSRQSTVSMVIDPWSVSNETLDFLAAQFFAVSLFPYLAFLYFLERPQNETPPLVAFGFRFLLVFVFATIPAGIYAKTHYGDILANVDVLHGSAESLLTITNLFIAVGLRNAMPLAPDGVTKAKPGKRLNAPGLTTVVAALLSLSAVGFSLASAHAEPTNALSLPTWIIHISSLIEWLVAMGLVWKYADVTGNPRWKGLTWGMLPLHSSGICACTFHLFYNAPSLNLLVTIQAALTAFGNATMAAAAYRLSKYDGVKGGVSEATEPIGMGSEPVLVGFEDLAGKLRSDSNAVFVGKLFAISTVASVAVKWGELYSDSVFNPTPAVALSIILIPSALNMAKWAVRSRAPDSSLNKVL